MCSMCCAGWVREGCKEPGHSGQSGDSWAAHGQEHLQVQQVRGPPLLSYGSSLAYALARSNTSQHITVQPHIRVLSECGSRT